MNLFGFIDTVKAVRIPIPHWTIKTLSLPLHSFVTGLPSSNISLSRDVFMIPREDIIARVLKYEESMRAQNTASTKQLGQVRGSTRKPFPQKGRGKARVGTLRAPQFRGGYTVHGPRPGGKIIDIQRKVYTLGIRSTLGAKFYQDQLMVVDKLEMDTISKPKLKEILAGLGLDNKKICFVYGGMESHNMIQTTDMFVKKRTEKSLLMVEARFLSVYMMMEYDYLVMDKKALEIVEEIYSSKPQLI